MSFSIAARNSMLDSLGTIATFISLHDAPPTDAGINEISGGTPAYARKPISWDAASSGKKNKDATDPIFDIPITTDVMFVGYWTAITGGTFLGYSPLSGGDVSGVGCADAATDVITSVGNGLVDTNKIILSKVHDEALPSGLAEDTIYYVVSATSDTFKLSVTVGGAEIDITVSAELRFQRVVSQTYNAQGTAKIDTVTLDMVV